jgi:hypothetical protein
MVASIVVIASSTRSASAGAERDALHVDVGQVHRREDNGERQRNGERDHEAGPHAERDEADGEDDRHRLPQGFHELGDRASHRHRLIGDEMGSDPQRQIGGRFRDRRVDILAERQNVAPLGHRNRKADRGLAIDAEHRLGRVRIAAPDRRDVTEAQQAPVDGEIGRQNVRFGVEGAPETRSDSASSPVSIVPAG